MKIAATIPTWRDGAALEHAIASVAPFVDEVIVLEAGLAGVVPPAEVSFPTLSAARNALLDEATRRGCVWALGIDADEALHRGELLRPILESWPIPFWPIAFEFESGRCTRAPWKLVRTDVFRLAAQSCYFTYRGRPGICLLGGDRPTDEPAIVARLKSLPWLSHHPELRPAERRELRLHALESELEPVTDAGQVWTPALPPLGSPLHLGTYRAIFARMSDSAKWYCPGCGRRYDVAGECAGDDEQPHEPIVLEAVKPATSKPEPRGAGGAESSATAKPKRVRKPAAKAAGTAKPKRGGAGGKASSA